MTRIPDVVSNELTQFSPVASVQLPVVESKYSKVEVKALAQFATD